MTDIPNTPESKSRVPLVIKTPAEFEDDIAHTEVPSEKTDDDTTAEESESLASGGWCAPSDFVFGLVPESGVSRGGLRFTAPKPLTKKQLQARLDETTAALNRERRRNVKLRRKNRRLLKLIGRGL